MQPQSSSYNFAPIYQDLESQSIFGKPRFDPEKLIVEKRGNMKQQNFMFFKNVVSILNSKFDGKAKRLTAKQIKKHLIGGITSFVWHWEQKILKTTMPSITTSAPTTTG